MEFYINDNKTDIHSFYSKLDKELYNKIIEDSTYKVSQYLSLSRDIKSRLLKGNSIILNNIKFEVIR